jgi:gp57
MNFKQGFINEGNKTYTTNGAEVYKSTMNNLVDLFGTIGDIYNNDTQKIVSLFINALNEDKELAIKTLFYSRDCRGGMGNRKNFLAIAKYLIENNQGEYIYNNLGFIDEFGRFKDLVELNLSLSEDLAKPITEFMIEYLFTEKIKYEAHVTKELSLAWKWLPTINSRSKHTRQKAKKLLSRFNKVHNYFKMYSYQKEVAKYRKLLKVVERDICANTFENISYPSVPSKCMNMNYGLFYKKDTDRFNKYLQELKQGKTKINSSVLFPRDIVHKYGTNPYNVKDVLEEQWKALPNYFTKPMNIIPLVDTSGSMIGTPMEVSMSLGIYLAERNPSEAFKNLILEFGRDAHLYDISNKPRLIDKLNGFNGDCGNTNLQKAFLRILNIGRENKLKQEDMPSHLVIISDMQFDSATTYSDKYGIINHMRDQFNQNGYELPQIIYWNVNNSDNFPEIAKDGICYVSGYSPTIMMAVLNAEILTPIEVIKKAVLIDRYKNIWYKGE